MLTGAGCDGNRFPLSAARVILRAPLLAGNLFRKHG